MPKILALRDYHQVPVCAIHAPCLLITQRVWGTDPWHKLERSAEMAKALDADVVVVHPPFVWQRAAAADFPASVAELQSRTDVRIAGLKVGQVSGQRLDPQSTIAMASGKSKASVPATSFG